MNICFISLVSNTILSILSFDQIERVTKFEKWEKQNDEAKLAYGKGCGAGFSSEEALVDFTSSPNLLAEVFNRSMFNLVLLPIYNG